MNTSTNERFSLGQRLIVLGVSLYLLLAGTILVAAGRVKVPSLRKVIRARWSAPFNGALGDYRTETGHCYVASVPDRLLSDLDSVSSLVLYEDERPLGPAHAAHADIRGKGGGRFSHWGPALYFSTSDNSDPRANGRRYTVREERRR